MGELTFAAVRSALERSISNRALHHIPHQQLDEIQKVLLEAFLLRRLYVIGQDSEVAEVWKLIRGSTPTTDFLLSLSNEFRFVLEIEQLDFNKLCESIAAAVGQHNTVQGSRTAATQSSSIDSDLLLSLPNKKDLLPILLHNSWYVTLLLMDWNMDLLSRAAIVQR